MQIKTCTQCGLQQNESLFRKKKAKCNDCLNANYKAWCVRNPEKLQGYRRKYAKRHFTKRKERLENPYYKAKTLVQAAKNRAKRSGSPCDISWEWVLQRMIDNSMCCEATGVKFDFATLAYRGQGQKNPLSPSIDKIDAMKGYTLGNTQVVCWFYNVAKSTFDEKMIWNIMRRAVEFKGDA